MKGRCEKAVTASFWRISRGIHDKVAPVSTNNDTSSVRPGAARFANFTFASRTPIWGFPPPSSGALHLCQQLHEFLLPFGLVVAAFGFRHLRDVHRAKFRPAHRAELRFFIKIIR